MTALLALALLTAATPARAQRERDGERALLARHNQERCVAGSTPLVSHPAIVGAARSWADQMMAAGHLHHAPNEARTAGYPSGWTLALENVGAIGRIDIDALHAAFMDSSTHRATILDARLNYVGIGVAQEADTRLWASVRFMAHPADFFAESFATTRWADYSSDTGWATHVVGDFNGDARDDVASFHPSNGTWFVGESDGRRFNVALWADFPTDNGWSSQVVGDFDGDGRDDIANFHPSNGTWWVSISTGRGFDTGKWADFLTDSGWATQVVGDFNGDGRDDIANFHPVNGTWWVSLSTGTSFITRWWADYPIDRGWAGHAVADLDGDGRDDIVAVHSARQRWAFSIAGAGAFTTTEWAIPAAAASWHTAGAGDFDGDGGDDIAGMTGAGEVWVARWTGSRPMVAPWAALPTDADAAVARVGDFNRDGLADVAAYRPSAGTWEVAESRCADAAFSTLRPARWAALDPRSAWSAQPAGDFDGDGVDDVAHFSPRNGTWWVSLAS